MRDERSATESDRINKINRIQIGLISEEIRKREKRFILPAFLLSLASLPLISNDTSRSLCCRRLLDGDCRS